MAGCGRFLIRVWGATGIALRLLQSCHEKRGVRINMANWRVVATGVSGRMVGWREKGRVTGGGSGKGARRGKGKEEGTEGVKVELDRRETNGRTCLVGVVQGWSSEYLIASAIATDQDNRIAGPKSSSQPKGQTQQR